MNTCKLGAKTLLSSREERNTKFGGRMLTSLATRTFSVYKKGPPLTTEFFEEYVEKIAEVEKIKMDILIQKVSETKSVEETLDLFEQE